MGSNIYLATEKPCYPVRFGTSLAMVIAFGIIWPPIYAWTLNRTNQRRAAMPVEEIQAKYTAEELACMGDLSPLYRYAT